MCMHISALVQRHSFLSSWHAWGFVSFFPPLLLWKPLSKSQEELWADAPAGTHMGGVPPCISMVLIRPSLNPTSSCVFTCSSLSPPVSWLPIWSLFFKSFSRILVLLKKLMDTTSHSQAFSVPAKESYLSVTYLPPRSPFLPFLATLEVRLPANSISRPSIQETSKVTYEREAICITFEPHVTSSYLTKYLSLSMVSGHYVATNRFQWVRSKSRIKSQILQTKSNPHLGHNISFLLWQNSLDCVEYFMMVNKFHVQRRL